MTRILLIHAGPTPWDEENRVTGAHGLPLAPDAVAAAQSLVDAIAVPVEAVYVAKANEACAQVAKMLGDRFHLRVRDNAGLDEVRLGLWEGLTREDLAHRFETVFEQWEKRPLSVSPPEGETVAEAIDRLRPALRKILRRNRDRTIALVLHPLAMQITHGLLRGESPEAISEYLHNVDVMETIELTDEQIASF